MHSSHFGKKLGPFFTSFTGVTNDTNEGSVPFWSNRVRVLILCMLAHWKHSQGSLRGFQMDLKRCVKVFAHCRVFSAEYRSEFRLLYYTNYANNGVQCANVIDLTWGGFYSAEKTRQSATTLSVFHGFIPSRAESYRCVNPLKGNTTHFQHWTMSLIHLRAVVWK